MSTIYYFKPTEKNRKVIAELVPYIYEDKLDDFLSLPIGQRSSGSLPVFYRTSYYKSLKELKKFYDKNSDALMIVDEYDKNLSWDELKTELIDWNKNNDEAKNPVKYQYYGMKKDEDGFIFISC